MTGEVTLRGKALQIGGLKEKLLAAKRGGALEALIPWNNQNDLTEIPREIKKGVKITPLKSVFQYLEIALERMPEPVVEPEGGDKPTGMDEMIQPGSDVQVPPTVYTLDPSKDPRYC